MSLQECGVVHHGKNWPAMAEKGHRRPLRPASIALPTAGMVRKQTRHGGRMAGLLCARSGLYAPQIAFLFNHLVGERE